MGFQTDVSPSLGDCSMWSTSESRHWNGTMLKKFLILCDVEEVMGIQQSDISCQDSLIRHFEENENYPVRS